MASLRRRMSNSRGQSNQRLQTSSYINRTSRGMGVNVSLALLFAYLLVYLVGSSDAFADFYHSHSSSPSAAEPGSIDWDDFMMPVEDPRPLRNVHAHTTDKWEDAGTLNRPLFYASVVLANESFFLVGGCKFENCSKEGDATKSGDYFMYSDTIQYDPLKETSSMASEVLALQRGVAGRFSTARVLSNMYVVRSCSYLLGNAPPPPSSSSSATTDETNSTRTEKYQAYSDDVIDAYSEIAMINPSRPFINDTFFKIPAEHVRANASCVSIENYILIIGGRNLRSGTLVNAIDVFDVVGKKYTNNYAHLSEVVMNPSVVSDSGSLIVAGGTTTNSSSNDATESLVPSQQVERLHLTSNGACVANVTDTDSESKSLSTVTSFNIGKMLDEVNMQLEEERDEEPEIESGSSRVSALHMAHAKLTAMHDVLTDDHVTTFLFADQLLMGNSNWTTTTRVDFRALSKESEKTLLKEHSSGKTDPLARSIPADPEEIVEAFYIVTLDVDDSESDLAAGSTSGPGGSSSGAPQQTRTRTLEPEVNVATPTATRSMTRTATRTKTLTPTHTLTIPRTDTSTLSETETYTGTMTATESNTLTRTRTHTLTPSQTATFTSTATASQTDTFTDSPTGTFSLTETHSLSNTLSSTLTFTESLIPPPTPTHTFTQTITLEPQPPTPHTSGAQVVTMAAISQVGSQVSRLTLFRIGGYVERIKDDWTRTFDPILNISTYIFSMDLILPVTNFNRTEIDSSAGPFQFAMVGMDTNKWCRARQSSHALCYVRLSARIDCFGNAAGTTDAPWLADGDGEARNVTFAASGSSNPVYVCFGYTTEDACGSSVSYTLIDPFNSWNIYAGQTTTTLSPDHGNANRTIVIIMYVLVGVAVLTVFLAVLLVAKLRKVPEEGLLDLFVGNDDTHAKSKKKYLEAFAKGQPQHLRERFRKQNFSRRRTMSAFDDASTDGMEMKEPRWRGVLLWPLRLFGIAKSPEYTSLAEKGFRGRRARGSTMIMNEREQFRRASLINRVNAAEEMLRDNDRYQLISKVGEGPQSIVYLAIHKQNGSRLALKYLEYDDDAARTFAIHQCELLRDLPKKHQFLLRLSDLFVKYEFFAVDVAPAEHDEDDEYGTAEYTNDSTRSNLGRSESDGSGSSNEHSSGSESGKDASDIDSEYAAGRRPPRRGGKRGASLNTSSESEEIREGSGSENEEDDEEEEDNAVSEIYSVSDDDRIPRNSKTATKSAELAARSNRRTMKFNSLEERLLGDDDTVSEQSRGKERKAGKTKYQQLPRSPLTDRNSGGDSQNTSFDVSNSGGLGEKKSERGRKNSSQQGGGEEHVKIIRDVRRHSKLCIVMPYMRHGDLGGWLSHCCLPPLPSVSSAAEHMSASTFRGAPPTPSAAAAVPAITAAETDYSVRSNSSYAQSEVSHQAAPHHYSTLPSNNNGHPSAAASASDIGDTDSAAIRDSVASSAMEMQTSHTSQVESRTGSLAIPRAELADGQETVRLSTMTTSTVAGGSEPTQQGPTPLRLGGGPSDALLMQNSSVVHPVLSSSNAVDSPSATLANVSSIREIYPPAIPECVLCSIAYQVNDALHFLHTQLRPMQHGNVKPENVLISSEEDSVYPAPYTSYPPYNGSSNGDNTVGNGTFTNVSVIGSSSGCGKLGNASAANVYSEGYATGSRSTVAAVRATAQHDMRGRRSGNSYEEDPRQSAVPYSGASFRRSGGTVNGDASTRTTLIADPRASNLGGGAPPLYGSNVESAAAVHKSTHGGLAFWRSTARTLVYLPVMLSDVGLSQTTYARSQLCQRRRHVQQLIEMGESNRAQESERDSHLRASYRRTSRRGGPVVSSVGSAAAMPHSIASTQGRGKRGRARRNKRRGLRKGKVQDYRASFRYCGLTPLDPCEESIAELGVFYSTLYYTAPEYFLMTAEEEEEDAVSTSSVAIPSPELEGAGVAVTPRTGSMRKRGFSSPSKDAPPTSSSHNPSATASSNCERGAQQSRDGTGKESVKEKRTINSLELKTPDSLKAASGEDGPSSHRGGIPFHPMRKSAKSTASRNSTSSQNKKKEIIGAEDMWSLGCVLYAAATGTVNPPYRVCWGREAAKDILTARQSRNQADTLLPYQIRVRDELISRQLSPQFVWMILLLMMPNPEHRLTSAALTKWFRKRTLQGQGDRLEYNTLISLSATRSKAAAASSLSDTQV